MGTGNDNDRHVVPQDGRWAVVKEAHERASTLHDAQADAINRAREIITNLGGGELVIHGENGQIRRKDSVGGGNDPATSEG